jgi:hypothetical protein
MAGYAALWESEVRGAAERFFEDRLPGGRHVAVGTALRGTYIEVMVFIADLKDDPELQQQAEDWARELGRELDADGYATVVYVRSYTPSRVQYQNQ